jgi:hypothetical protein
MNRNLSNLDRAIRVVLAAVLAYLYFGGVVAGVLGIVLLILAVVFLATAVIGFCPLYAPFKLSTYKG